MITRPSGGRDGISTAPVPSASTENRTTPGRPRLAGPVAHPDLVHPPLTGGREPRHLQRRLAVVDRERAVPVGRDDAVHAAGVDRLAVGGAAERDRHDDSGDRGCADRHGDTRETQPREPPMRALRRARRLEQRRVRAYLPHYAGLEVHGRRGLRHVRQQSLSRRGEGRQRVGARRAARDVGAHQRGLLVAGRSEDVRAEQLGDIRAPARGHVATSRLWRRRSRPRRMRLFTVPSGTPRMRPISELL